MQSILLLPRRPSRSRGSAALSLAFTLLAARACLATGPAIPVNVGSFGGPDQRLSHTVAEIMLADLSKSQRLAVLDARHNSSEEARVGYTLVGSCVPEGGEVLINLRIVMAGNGRSVPGAAESIEGPRSQLFPLAHRLAARFSNRLAYLPAPVWSAATPSAPALAARLESGIRAADSFVEQAVAERMDRESAPRSEPEGRAVGRIEAHSESPDRHEHYTSVIIDARGLGLDRSMSPKLRRKDGMVVWDGGNADPDYAIEEGIVSYVDTMRQARDSSRAGAHPLIIEAVGKYETPFPSDPLLTDDDAELVQRCGAHDGFLKKFRVIIITGK